MIYYQNSLIITCALLLESIIVKAITNSERPPLGWINKSFMLIRNKQFDFMFFSSKQDENNDENNLIDGKQIENLSNAKFWRDFGSVLDKIVLIIISIIYVLMIYTLIPSRYAKNSNPIMTA